MLRVVSLGHKTVQTSTAAYHWHLLCLLGPALYKVLTFKVF